MEEASDNRGTIYTTLKYTAISVKKNIMNNFIDVKLNVNVLLSLLFWNMKIRSFTCKNILKMKLIKM